MNIIIFSIFSYVTLFFFISLIIKKICIVDVAWAFGFLLVLIVSMMNLTTWNYPQILLLAMTACWSFRLGSYLFFRLLHKPDDWRYLELKKGWKNHWILQSYFKVFLLQGTLLFLCSSTLWYGVKFLSETFTLFNGIGLGLWLLGFSFESYADGYLKQFKNNPKNKGQFCSTGPWSICRYPNYLGEITLWFGIYIFIFNLTSWWTIFSPLLLAFIIVKFSGIPFLEKHMIKYPGYKEYQVKVPMIIPWFKSL